MGAPDLSFRVRRVLMALLKDQGNALAVYNWQNGVITAVVSLTTAALWSFPLLL